MSEETEEEKQLMENGASDSFVDLTRPGKERQSLNDKLVILSNSIGVLRKDGEMQFQRGGDKKPYLSEEAVKVAVQKGQKLANLAPAKEEIELISSKDSPLFSQNGKQYATEHHYVMRMTITFRDEETGEERSFQGWGEGKDARDKGIMKAQTAAFRETWKNVACIPGSEEPEKYMNAPKPPPTAEKGPDEPAGRKADSSGDNNREEGTAPKNGAKPDLTRLKEPRKKLGFDPPHVMAIAKHMFGLPLSKLDQSRVDALVEVLKVMKPEAAKEVKGGSMKSIPTFETGGEG